MTLKLIAPAGQGGIVQGRSGTSYTIGSDGTISNVQPSDVAPLLDAGYSLYGLNVNKASFNSPLPADLVSVVNAATPANGAIVIAAQPPHARKLQYRIVLGTPGTTNITAGTMTAVYLDQDGNQITEVVALNQFGAVSGTAKSKFACSKFISGTIAGYAANGSGTGNTFGIGVSNDFGVSTLQAGAGFGGVNLACVKATKITKVLGTSNVAADDVASTTTVDTTARTIAPTTAPAANGLVDYEFTYAYGGAA
jgi:hypothetical protein